MGDLSMYFFSTVLKSNMADVEAKVVAALATEGFGVLTEIDVQATMKKKLDIDKPPYKILGACNPKLANHAIDAEPDIGLLLPCNVVLRENEDGDVVVSFMDPEAVFQLVDRDDIKSVATDVKASLERVCAALN